jgi:hypothetical protein
VLFVELLLELSDKVQYVTFHLKSPARSSRVVVEGFGLVTAFPSFHVNAHMHARRLKPAGCCDQPGDLAKLSLITNHICSVAEALSLFTGH